ncbi:MAG TPA: hypothetical protein DCS93_20500 [Microscillaceae bacterium]|nr:hypothetical protein [Microscillaceae bacterium]
MINLLQYITGFTFFHGLVLFLVLSFRPRDKKTQNDVKFIVLAFTLYIGEFLLVITGTIVRLPHLILMSYPLLFCIGPLFLIFAQKATYSFQKKTYAWFIVPVIFYLLFIPFYATEPAFKLSILGHFSTLKDRFPLLYMLSGNSLPFNGFTLCFLMWAIFILRTKATRSPAARQIRKFLTGLVIFLGVYTIGQVIWLFYPIRPLGIALFFQPFAFALGLHILGYWLILTPVLSRPLVKSDSNSYLKSPLPQEYKNKYVEKLQTLFKEEKPFLNNDFSSDILAQQLGISKHYLSQVLSQELQTSFPELVNASRIQEACRLLEQQESPVIQQVALEVGYNNKVSFYRAFKKFTQQTPSDYVAQSRQNQVS